MPQREDILKELGNDAPHLQGIEGEGFQVPEGYFEQLPNLVFAKIQAEETLVSSAKKKRLNALDVLLNKLVIFSQPRHATLAFASLALLVAAIFLLTKRNTAVETLALEDLERAEVVQYIESNLDEFEEELFLVEVEYAPKNEYLESILEEIDVNTLEELF
ncbi:MAG: hypothetical protein AAGG68_08880 [Bacteroidota bacterium]